MPDVYTTSLRLTDQTNGENSATWGDRCDTNFAILERAICGTLVKSVAGAGDTTLTNTDGSLNESQHAAYELTGVVTGNANVIVPTSVRRFAVFNNTTGAFTRTIKTAAGSGILVPQGRKMLLRCDGVNVVEDLSAVTQLAILGSMDESKGADIASAATTNIWATDGNYSVVTGVTGITSFGTAPRAGARRKVRHSGILTITNGANLICPGGANITTQVDDTYEVIADTTATHRIHNYTRADGTALIAPTGVATLAGNPNAFTGTETFTRSDLTTPLQAVSTDAGAAEFPALDLFRDSASPAAGDLLVSIIWSARSSAAIKRTGAKLLVKLLDPTNASEDSEVAIWSKVAGGDNEVIRYGQGQYAPGVTGGDKGAGSGNFIALFVGGVAVLADVNALTLVDNPASGGFVPIYDITAGAVRKGRIGEIGGWVPLAELTAAASANLSFDFSAFTTDFEDFEFIGSMIAPASDTVDLLVRTAQDGTTFDSGAGSYAYQTFEETSAGATQANSASATSMQVNAGDTLGNAANETMSFRLLVHNAPQAAAFGFLTWAFGIQSSTSRLNTGTGTGRRLTAAAIKGIQFRMSAGNIATGKVTVLGRRKVT
jgi:hypothetical protein